MNGRLLVVAALLLWSTGGPLLREAGMGWAAFVFFANVAGQGTLLLRRGRSLFAGFRAMPKGLLFVLSGSLALNVVTLFSAFEMTTLTTALLLHYTAPVLVAAAAPAVLGEPRGRHAAAALALAALGTALVVASAPRGGLPPDARPVAGALLALLSAAGYAGLVLSMRRAARDGHDADLVAFAISFPLTLLVVPFVPWEAVTLRGAALAALGGILHIPVAAVLYAKGLETVPAEAAGILGYLEVVFVSIWDALLYGARPTAGLLAGGALIVAGGVLALRPPPPPRR